MKSLFNAGFCATSFPRRGTILDLTGDDTTAHAGAETRREERDMRRIEQKVRARGKIAELVVKSEKTRRKSSKRTRYPTNEGHNPCLQEEGTEKESGKFTGADSSSMEQTSKQGLLWRSKRVGNPTAGLQWIERIAR